MQETWVLSLGQEDPLEEVMATHISMLAWEIPWTESLAGYSLWSCKESDTTEHAHHHTTASFSDIGMYNRLLLFMRLGRKLVIVSGNLTQ